MDAHARLGVRMGLWGGEAQLIETGERIVVSDEETILKRNQISQLGGQSSGDVSHVPFTHSAGVHCLV